MVDEQPGNPVVGEPSPRPPSRPIELEVDEGMMLLENAARLKLKNRIVVDTLTSGDAGPSAAVIEAWVGLLADQLKAFAAQSVESAQRLAVERDIASSSDGLGRYYHDYRHLDTDNLTRRVRISAEVARRLRNMVADPAVLARLLSDARSLADDELTSAVRATLAAAPRSVPEDAALLAGRIQQLSTIDLPALAEDAARRRGESQDESAGRLRRTLSRLRGRRAPERR